MEPTEAAEGEAERGGTGAARPGTGLTLVFGDRLGVPPEGLDAECWDASAPLACPLASSSSAMLSLACAPCTVSRAHLHRGSLSSSGMMRACRAAINNAIYDRVAAQQC